jgi:hypothetical protein
MCLQEITVKTSSAVWLGYRDVCPRNRGSIRDLERLIFLGLKRKEHEPDPSPLSKIQVKND